MSPRNGRAPSPASSATLPAIRSSVARDAPMRIAATSIHPARTAPAASPPPGINPRIGSRPKRRLVPGIRIPASNQYANWETARRLGEDVSRAPPDEAPVLTRRRDVDDERNDQSDDRPR